MSTDYVSNVKNIRWKEPWRLVETDLSVQLKKEAGADHPLFSQKAVTIAHRIDNDEVLFYLPDYIAPFAVVHLTWSNTPSTYTIFPWTIFYASIDDLTEKLNSDSNDYESLDSQRR